MRSSRRFVLVAIGAALVAPRSFAQAPTVVRLRVCDSAGAPVARAEVAVVRGVREVVASGTTGEGGEAIVGAALDSGEYHVVVRGRDTVAIDPVAHAATTATAPRAADPPEILVRFPPAVPQGRAGDVRCQPGRDVRVNDRPLRVALGEPATSESVAAYRARRLVVYDAINGEPVVGVEVTRVATGSKGVTDLSGAVTLGFLPEGESSVRVARTGYQPIELPVTISPADDRPITLLLRRVR